MVGLFFSSILPSNMLEGSNITPIISDVELAKFNLSDVL